MIMYVVFTSKKNYMHFPLKSTFSLVFRLISLKTIGAVGGAYKPEQFWNCAEIRIIPFPGAPPTPIPEPLPEDWRTAPTPPTVAVTNAPTSSPCNRCGASWTDAVDSCRPEQWLLTIIKAWISKRKAVHAVSNIETCIGCYIMPLQQNTFAI